MKSNLIRFQKSDNKIDLFIMGIITDRTGRHGVLLPFNHKNYHFREKKNSQIMNERVNSHYKTLTKETTTF